MTTRRSMTQQNKAGIVPQQNSYVQQHQQQNAQARQALLQQQQAQEQKPVITEQTPVVTPPPTPVITDENGARKQRPDWQMKKLDPVTRRLRQNARVKKVVKPKPANMVLHEMYPDIVYKIDEVASNKTSIYRVHFELKDKNFSGEGFSKSMAKQNACEQALKTLLMEKLAKEAEEEKKEKEKDGEAMEVDSNPKVPATDDFPWAKMASFALQKLMDSWNQKGTEQEIPNFVKTGAAGLYGGHQTFSNPNHVSFSNYNPGFAGYPSQPFKPAGPKVQAHPRKKFPENPLEYNPVALFNQTWPNTEPTFDAISKEGGIEHAATLVLEGFRFSASAKSKKEVKLQIAKAIISTLKGVKYPDGFTAQVQHA